MLNEIEAKGPENLSSHTLLMKSTLEMADYHVALDPSDQPFLSGAFDPQQHVLIGQRGRHLLCDSRRVPTYAGDVVLFISAF